MTSFAQSHPPIHRPQLPDGVRIYAISDIHGCSHLLQPMLRVIDADLAHSRPRYAIEVFMGDYVDRGRTRAPRLTSWSNEAGGETRFFSRETTRHFSEGFRRPFVV